MKPFAPAATETQVHLRILGTTDLHVHIYPYDYYADRPAPGLGLAGLAHLIARFRTEAPNSLLLDNGDFLQGSPLGDYVALERGFPDAAPHPMIAAMNAAGYDAATLGNHEFNYGLEFLCRTLADARFPVVSANLVTRMGDHPAEDATLLPPYVILERKVTSGVGGQHDLKIGLIGFLPPQVMAWDRAHLEGRVSVRDIFTAAEGWVPRLRADGADVVIALSHSGIGAALPEPGMENASVALAAIDGVDAVLAGHSHGVFPGPGHAGLDAVDIEAGTLSGKPAAMGGALGSHLAVIDLLLEQDGAGWRVAAHRSLAQPVPPQTPGTQHQAHPVLAAAASGHAATLAYLRRPVGQTRKPLQNYFALVAPDATLTLLADAKRNAIRIALADTPHADLPVLASVAPFRAGGLGRPDSYTDIPVGPLSIRNVADLYHFPNALRAVRLTGAEVKEWLERAAGVFCRLRPGQDDQPLIDLTYPGYHFDVLDGLSYDIDLSGPARYGQDGRLCDPAAERIRGLSHAGRPVLHNDEFIVATNSYRVGGGGRVPLSLGDRLVWQSAMTVRAAIETHIRAASPLDVAPRMCWRFHPLPGVCAIFETGPGARAHLPQAHLPGLTDMGNTGGGFARFLITF